MNLYYRVKLIPTEGCGECLWCAWSVSRGGSSARRIRPLHSRIKNPYFRINGVILKYERSSFAVRKSPSPSKTWVKSGVWLFKFRGWGLSHTGSNAHLLSQELASPMVGIQKLSLSRRVVRPVLGHSGIRSFWKTWLAVIGSEMFMIYVASTHWCCTMSPRA